MKIPAGLVTYLYIAAGGAVGSMARFALSGWVQDRTGETFPWGTLAVNVVGSFLLGLSLWFLEGTAAPARVRALVAVGILGGFTTFSTFSYEAVVLFQGGAPTRGLLYTGASVFAALAGVALGMSLGATLLRPR